MKLTIISILIEILLGEYSNVQIQSQPLEQIMSIVWGIRQKLFTSNDSDIFIDQKELFESGIENLLT